MLQACSWGLPTSPHCQIPKPLAHFSFLLTAAHQFQLPKSVQVLYCCSTSESERQWLQTANIIFQFSAGQEIPEWLQWVVMAQGVSWGWHLYTGLGWSHLKAWMGLEDLLPSCLTLCGTPSWHGRHLSLDLGLEERRKPPCVLWPHLARSLPQ